MEIVNAGVRKWQIQNEWYSSLDQAQRLIFIDLLRECAKNGTLGFCSLFDGTIDTDTIDGTSAPKTRRFKVSMADENGQEIIVNLGESDRLRDLVYEIYVEKHGL